MIMLNPYGDYISRFMLYVIYLQICSNLKIGFSFVSWQKIYLNIIKYRV